MMSMHLSRREDCSLAIGSFGTRRAWQNSANWRLLRLFRAALRSSRSARRWSVAPVQFARNHTWPPGGRALCQLESSRSDCHQDPSWPVKIPFQSLHNTKAACVRTSVQLFEYDGTQPDGCAGGQLSQLRAASSLDRRPAMQMDESKRTACI
jgi:hypothetical protein